MKNNFHPLLAEQVNKYINDELMEIPELSNLLEEINNTYKNFEDNYKQLEKLLDISVKKLTNISGKSVNSNN